LRVYSGTEVAIGLENDWRNPPLPFLLERR